MDWKDRTAAVRRHAIRAILVRVGIDATAGRWNAPADPLTGEFVYVPIPEVKEALRPDLARLYDELEDPLSRVGAAVPEHLRGKKMHLDPDFEFLTYGDKDRRGAQVKNLKHGDIIVFYAGLRSTVSPEKRLIYSLIGLFVVDEVLPALEVPKCRWHENAHTRRIPDDKDVVVRAIPGLSGKLERHLPIGEYRQRSYRVREDLLEAWSGLNIKNGYIQRSAYLPVLTDPRCFQRWFERQGVQVCQQNW